MPEAVTWLHVDVTTKEISHTCIPFYVLMNGWDEFKK